MNFGAIDVPTWCLALAVVLMVAGLVVGYGFGRGSAERRLERERDDALDRLRAASYLTALVKVVPEGSLAHQGRIGPNTGRFAGEVVRVKMPPIVPQRGAWACGTRYVLELSPESCATLGLAGPRFVCEHQVELQAWVEARPLT